MLEDVKDSVIDALVKINGSFSKLRNPVLRNLTSRRVTVADACQMAGCTLEEFIDKMRGLGFSIAAETAGAPVDAGTPTLKKASNFVELDLRPILADNRDPLKIILDAINNLKSDQGLKLINTFEPLPLIHFLSERGFTHILVKPDPVTVITYFNRIIPGRQVTIGSLDDEYASSQELFDAALQNFQPGSIKYIDVRGLQMPGPMITILENLKGLSKDGALFVYHKRRPVFLLSELTKRGYRYLFKDIAALGVNMLIFKS